MVTSNQIHLLVVDDGDGDVIPKTMQLVAGRTGQESNQYCLEYCLGSHLGNIVCIVCVLFGVTSCIVNYPICILHLKRLYNSQNKI